MEVGKIYTNNKKYLYKQAEDRAANILRNRKYIILARNIIFHGTEIDLLCKQDGTYFFFEVKCLKLLHYQNGFIPFQYRQWNRYKNAIHKWYTANNKVYHTSIGIIIFDHKLNLLNIDNNIQF